MSSSWAPAKAQPRWALPGVLWQLLLGVGGEETGTGMGRGMGTGMGMGTG